MTQEITNKFAFEPEDLAILHDIAATAYMSRDFDRAAKVFRAMTVMQPEYAEAHAGLASCLTWAKDYDAAIDEYKIAVKHCNTEKCANLQLGELLLFHRKDEENAKLFLKKVVALDADGRWGGRAKELLATLN